MPSPFPGMDPYLERGALWKEVHTDLITKIRHFLAPLLRPKYRVAIEQHTTLELLPPEERSVGIPDVLVIDPLNFNPSSTTGGIAVLEQIRVTPQVTMLPMPTEVKERHLEIRDVAHNQVVTVIEILSPRNKIGQDGRERYNRKRMKVLGSVTHLVEIDLLRAGEPFPMQPGYDSHYRLLISRWQKRPQADIYPFNVRHLIPDLPIPLREEDEEPILPLNKILHEIYEQGSYDLAINYGQPPTPALNQANADWAAELVQNASTTP